MAEQTNGRKPNGQFDKEYWTPERRAAQAEIAKGRIERGEMGGPHHGRRRKKPAYQVIAAKAATNADRLGAVLLDMALEGRTEAIRLNAIKQLMDIEQRAHQERRDEEDHLMRLSGDELTGLLVDRLRELTGLDFDVEAFAEDIPDAEKVEEGDGGDQEPLELEAG